MQKLIEEAGPRVRFYGAYQNAEMPRLMQSVDWVVMPSIWWENSPIVIQEALHHRRPVICSNIGGMAEKFVMVRMAFISASAVPKIWLTVLPKC